MSSVIRVIINSTNSFVPPPPPPPPPPVSPPPPPNPTCMAKGTQILMRNKTWKPIEDIQIGEQVVTLNGRGHVVTGKHSPEITQYRHYILLRWNGRILKMSDDHDLWHKDENGDEQWGTYNYNWWLHDGAMEGTLNVPAVALIRSQPNLLAVVNGWQMTSIDYVQNHNPKELLYGLTLDGGGGYIAEGFVVIADYCQPEDIAGVTWNGVA